ncbi:MAG TPA: class I SAM-dependent methyltransferase [Thermoanaerobaculia bacterium]|nr:class I SAM-dependent methyltransferase [Thermoanaerobaculia bacterium]
MSHRLFTEAARRYDLHTPPHHYQDDHCFVLEELHRLRPGCRVLDVGCGTGVFLAKARAAAFDARGIDASPEMIAVAAERVGSEAVRVERMQDLCDQESYDAVVSLSWSFNYCSSLAEAGEILARFWTALRPGGLLLLQVAHAENATSRLQEDWEEGPGGTENDVQFLYQFTPLAGSEPRLSARYVYACRSLNELICDEHILNAADAQRIAELAHGTGFRDLQIMDSWRRDPFSRSLSPFILGHKPFLAQALP